MVKSIGMKQEVSIQSELPVPALEINPLREIKTESIMKMQQQVLDLQNDAKYAQHVAETIAASNQLRKLNIV